MGGDVPEDTCRSDAPIDAAQRLDEEYESRIAEVSLDLVSRFVVDRLRVHPVEFGELQHGLLGRRERRFVVRPSLQNGRSTLFHRGRPGRMRIGRRNFDGIGMKPGEGQPAKIQELRTE